MSFSRIKFVHYKKELNFIVRIIIIELFYIQFTASKSREKSSKRCDRRFFFV